MYNLAEVYLEKVARIVSAHYNIQVVFHKDTCETNGRTIVLPCIPSNADIPFIKALNGMLDHEVAHCIFTDFNEAVSSTNTFKDQIIFSLLSALEDVRVEKELIKLWPGCKLNLHNLTEWTMRDIIPNWKAAPDIIQYTKSLYIYFLYPKLLGFFDDTVLENEQVAQWYEESKDVLKDLPARMFSTKDAKKEAERIYDTLTIPDQKGPNKEPSKSNKNKDSKNKNRKQGSQENPETAQPPKENNKEPDSPKESGGPQASESKPPSPRELKNASDKLDSKSMIKQHVKDLNYKSSSIKGANKPYRIYTTEHDITDYITNGDRVGTKLWLNEHDSMSESLKHKFAQVLQADNRSKFLFNKNRGTIHGGSLHRLVNPKSNNRIFKQRIKAKGFDTVAMMLIDHSGSMDGSNILLASQISLILGECLHIVKVPFAVWGYSTVGYYTGGNRLSDASSKDLDLYTRWGDLWIGVYKQLHESWPETRHRCYEMYNNTQANSYDGESVRKAANYLLRQPQARKILFVLCDGLPEPNVSMCKGVHQQYLKDIAKQVEKEIELYTFGMQVDHGNKYYSNFVNVKSFDDLKKIMLTKMFTLLQDNQKAFKR